MSRRRAWASEPRLEPPQGAASAAGPLWGFAEGKAWRALHPLWNVGTSTAGASDVRPGRHAAGFARTQRHALRIGRQQRLNDPLIGKSERR